jgi:hypothetical protein
VGGYGVRPEFLEAFKQYADLGSPETCILLSVEKGREMCHGTIELVSQNSKNHRYLELVEIQGLPNRD